MWPLPVSELFFVGRATTKKLLSLGIRTVGDLANTDPASLRFHLKKQGEVIWGARMEWSRDPSSGHTHQPGKRRLQYAAA